MDCITNSSWISVHWFQIFSRETPKSTKRRNIPGIPSEFLRVFLQNFYQRFSSIFSSYFIIFCSRIQKVLRRLLQKFFRKFLSISFKIKILQKVYHGFPRKFLQIHSEIFQRSSFGALKNPTIYSEIWFRDCSRFLQVFSQ